MHGTAAAAAFGMRRTRDPATLAALADLSKFWTRVSAAFFFLILISGIALGFIGHWWRQGWIWVSIVVFSIVLVLMNIRGTRKFYGVRWALGQEYLKGIKAVHGTGVLAEPDELDRRLRSVRPWELTVTGTFLLALLLALMVFKPF